MFILYWLTFAFVLIIMELIVGASFMLLWLGLSAAMVGVMIAIFPILIWPYTIVLFTVFACTSIVCGKLFNKYFKRRAGVSGLNQRTEKYVGQVFVLIEPIANGRGKIKIGDSTWIVTGPDSPEGTPVRVIGAIGVILQVVPVLS